MTRMKAIYDLVLSLHHSRKSSQQPSPRVALKRLSLETIKKYTGIRDVFESSCKSSPRKELSASVESSLEHEPEKEDYENFAVAVSEDEDSDSSSATKESNITGQREDEEDQDASGSSSSDELPDLNDPSWSSKEMKKKEMKIHKTKKKNVLQKTDAKLMKSARRAFQHQAVRYKASQEFMKTTKNSKEVQHPELKLPYPVHPPCNSTTINIKEKSKNVKNAMELPANSPVELMSLKLKESIIRYDRQERVPSVAEDVTGVEAQPTNTVEPENSDGEESDNSQDSINSDCTVYFDSNEMEEIYTTSSSLTLSEETSIDKENLVSSAHELNYSKKRKDSPLLEKPEETSKRQKHDGQEKATEIDGNQQPMVMVPFSISSSANLPSAVAMSTTPSCLVTSLVQVPLKTFRSTIDSSNAPSQLSDSVELETKENIEKEDSDLPCKISSVSSVATEKNHGDIVTTHEKASHPSNVPQDKYIVIDNDSSKESGDHSGENVCAITPEPLEDSGLFIKVSNVTSLSSSADTLIIDSTHKETNRDDSTNTTKEVVTDTSSKETDDQQEKMSSLSKEPIIGSKENAFKSLKELSLQFHELTTKRKECEKKIKEVKEEYNKKLEVLEEEKKNYDVDIEKMLVALSEYKELTEEFDKKQEPERQQELAVSDTNTTASECIPELIATAPASIAVVRVPEINHVMVPPTDLKKKSSSERIHINVIPAANIRNFGKEKSRSVLKMQSEDPDQQTTLPYKPRKKSEKKTKASSLRSFRHHPVHQEATISAPYQNLSVVETAVNVPHFQKQQHQSISGDCSARSRLLAQDVLHYSSFDKQSPPNAVVVPGQQRPVVTSSHIICAAPPQPITHTAQRRAPVCQVKAMSNNNPGLLPSGHKNPVSSQVLQKTQFIPVHSFLQQQQPHLFKLLQKTTLQKQKQPNLQHHQHQQQSQLQLSNRTLVIQQHQQQENNSQRYPQNYSPATGHLQNNITQGRVIPTTFSSPGSSNGVNSTTVHTASNFTPNTNAALKRMVVSDSTVEDSLICTGTNIQKTAYIPVVSSVNLNNLQAQSLNIVTDKRITDAVSSSHASTVTTTINTSQQETKSQTDISSHEVGITSEESEPICVMCKAPGIFMCCNNVIYCNTTCQGKDWATHQHICTNTSSLDSS